MSSNSTKVSTIEPCNDALKNINSQIYGLIKTINDTVEISPDEKEKYKKKVEELAELHNRTLVSCLDDSLNGGSKSRKHLSRKRKCKKSYRKNKYSKTKKSRKFRRSGRSRR